MVSLSERALVDPVHFLLEDLFPPTDEFHGDVVVVAVVGIERDRAAPKVARDLAALIDCCPSHL